MAISSNVKIFCFSAEFSVNTKSGNVIIHETFSCVPFAGMTVIMNITIITITDAVIFGETKPVNDKKWMQIPKTISAIEIAISFLIIKITTSPPKTILGISATCLTASRSMSLSSPSAMY